MKRIILSLILMTIPLAASAQVTTIPTTMPATASFSGDIRKQGENYIEMRSGRTYYVEDNMVVERLGVDSAGVILYNIFDFDNEIVFHKTDSNNLGILNTLFGAIPGPRLKQVKDYGCYVAKGTATAGQRSDDPRASFYTKFCTN